MKKIFILLFIVSSIYANQHQKFSNNIELISDSRISMKSNNLLTSNAPIYGRYYSNDFLQQTFNNGIYNVNCRKTKKLYKVINDCYMFVSKNDTSGVKNLKEVTADLLFLGEMDSKNISKFDYRTHMIECDYNKKYGLMHNCKVKIYRKIFN